MCAPVEEIYRLSTLPTMTWSIWLCFKIKDKFPATGTHLTDLPLCISREDFEQGYTLFVSNLNPDEDVEALSPTSSGNLRLEMRFRVPVPHTVTLVAYPAYKSILKINSKNLEDKHR